MLKKIAKWLLYSGAAVILVYAIFSMLVRPSNDRNWSLDQVILPRADITGSQVTVHNVRNFTYASTTSYTPHYYDRTYDVNKLKRVWFMVEPFTSVRGAAHTLVSFEFEDDVFVAVSVEIRKEKGETYSPLKGMLRQYELMYVIADERDVIKLRSNYRHDQVYLYPIKADISKARQMFLDMVSRANALAEQPEFYNTIWSTCTTNIADHVNEITPGRVPFSMKLLLPADADRLVYDLGMIDTTLSFEEARMKFNINERAAAYADDPDFSVRIREHLQKNI